ALRLSPGRRSMEVQQQLIRETFHLVLKRDEHICNFLECGSLFGGADYKLIYRHYATLYFVFCVDSSESELGILDLIQVFVETLDKCFENVCELDLIFHMDKVHYILQEVVIGGMVLETNMNEIVAQVEAQSKLEKAEVSDSLLSAASEPRGGLQLGREPFPAGSGQGCGRWAACAACAACAVLQALGCVCWAGCAALRGQRG
uniref:Adaptor related protein complex 3 subunit sigma 2 n=1 Tax=Anser cygnoides TaxID=8845 RepID=A0A8B9E7W2_ANSCY